MANNTAIIDQDQCTQRQEPTLESRADQGSGTKHVLSEFRLDFLPSLPIKHLVIVCILLIVIAIGYEWMYVGFLWDPVGRIQHLTVALVNQDKGFNLTNTSTQIQELTTELFNGHTAGAFIAGTIMDPALPIYHSL
ncbi:hypothetical protein K7432_012689, partial [Basidiobolus ranarum]